MPDARLLEAMQKIKVILNTYDIAGLVFLDSQTHSEFMVKFDPSWSCMSHEEREGEYGVKFRARLAEDYGGSKEKRDQAIAASLGILFGHVKMHELWKSNCEQLLMMATKNLGVVQSKIVDEGFHGDQR